MVYDMLIQSFVDGDWLIGIMCWVIAIGVSFLVAAGIGCGIDEYKWHVTPSFKIMAHLLSSSHKASTLETHAVPVVTGKGVGMGVVTTGESEKFTTIWECGKYGRLVADDEVIFQYAKPISELWIKCRDKECRIDGIKVSK